MCITSSVFIQLFTNRFIKICFQPTSIYAFFQFPDLSCVTKFGLVIAPLSPSSTEWKYVGWLYKIMYKLPHEQCWHWKVFIILNIWERIEDCRFYLLAYKSRRLQCRRTGTIKDKDRPGCWCYSSPLSRVLRAHPFLLVFLSCCFFLSWFSVLLFSLGFLDFFFFLGKVSFSMLFLFPSIS